VTGSRRRRGWDLHRARRDALLTVRAVLLQLYRVSARGVPRTRARAHERPSPYRQRSHDEPEPAPAFGERVLGARRTLGIELAGDESLALHSPEAIGKQLRRDAG